MIHAEVVGRGTIVVGRGVVKGGKAKPRPP
jgi:hypothetical protein